ncbi:hypothetical protein [Ostreibacterium oceani]|nr:hypothetical protein [Ostreibacterium oceani]
MNVTEATHSSREARRYQRPPEQLMQLSRLGCFHASRLSFMRVLLRRLYLDNWQFKQQTFAIDNSGEGYAVYTAQCEQSIYSLVAFAHDLPDSLRSDRVIAERWDTTFTLFDGVPSAADIARLQANVPLQEAGRISEKELSLSRANRSGRLWSYVIDCLAMGNQPDSDMIKQTGYLMRTTAVYGSGKFGAADREVIAERPEFSGPFQVEMLHVYLIRWFVRDLANALAKAQGGDKATTLDAGIARLLGIGNSTGLGMAPFIVNHPVLFNNWISAREMAIAKVCQLANADESAVALFSACFDASQVSVDNWQTRHPIQIEKLTVLRAELSQLAQYLQSFDWQQSRPWQALFDWVQDTLGADAQELFASLMLEPYPELVDGLAHCMLAPASSPLIDGGLSIARLRQTIESRANWALKTDWEAPDNRARVWYISEEKLEPRLGERFEEDIADYEQPLCTGKRIAELYQLTTDCETKTVGDFLFRHPQHRETVKRVLRLNTHPYAEIQDNTIEKTMLPIDMLRCKLSFFGATHFDPRSDRWVRIVMFQHAPYPDELHAENYDYWPYNGGLLHGG